jgi:enoyl-CoA hydratase
MHMASDASPVEVAVDGPVALITLSRPRARNAVDAAMANALEAAIDRIEEDDHIVVTILAARGPVFCAGADLKVIGAGGAASLETARGGFAGFCRRERAKPVIAAVDGPALAGGFEIVAACDLVVASHAARFAIPEVKRGLVAGAGGLVRLPWKLPFNLAVEAAVTGDPISAERAAGVGFVNALVEPDSAIDGARRLAQAIVANAPVAVRESLAVIRAQYRSSEEEAWAMSVVAFGRAVRSDDAAEGVRAFVEKRSPVWAGH